MASSNNDDAAARFSSWRSSTALVIFTATLGLFTENFLYAFIVPIIPYMFEVRLSQDPAYSQRYVSALLFIVGFIALFCAPIIGHFADKTSNRKIPLLISLSGCIIGTVLVAATPAVWVVFLGRIIQGASSSATWIVCFAMLTDSIDKKHFGKTLGFASSFITGGVLTGPAVAGAMLQWAGYWAAWSVPFTLLGIGFIARLIMVDTGKRLEPSSQSGDAGQQETSEVTRLLPDNLEAEGESPKSAVSSKGFYQIMLTDGSVVAALINVILFSTMVSAFDATFPLHLRNVFDWGPAPVGLIFLAIQIPGMITAPIVGWLRDRVGLRKPTAVGWILVAPLIFVLGVPGDWELSFLDTKAKTQAAFVGAIIAVGVVAPLVRGSGSFQTTITLRELQEKDPKTFGPHGGSSRMFSMVEVAFNIGLMLGPVLGGALTDTFGFFCTMFVLAVLCLVAAALSFIYLSDKRSAHSEADATSD